MSRGQEKTKKKSEERDVVLRLAVAAMIIWMVIGGVVFAVGVMNPREDPRKGLAKLERMEEADTAAIDAQIPELEEADSTRHGRTGLSARNLPIPMCLGIPLPRDCMRTRRLISPLLRRNGIPACARQRLA